MANSAEAARARRKLQKEGAKRLGPITVKDPEMWTEILRENSVVPAWLVGKELTDAQIRDATEKLISEECRKRRREEADRILQGVSNIKTGLIEREPAPDPEQQSLAYRPSAGGDWSFQVGQKKDKGRTYTEEEIEQLLEERPDLEEFTASPPRFWV